jgi:hypothetical protein
MYESFVKYQKRIIDRFDKMVEDYSFRVIDASRSIEEVFIDLRHQMSEVLNADREAASDPIARLKPSRSGRSTQEVSRYESRESDLRYFGYGPSDNRADELRRNELGRLLRP